MLEIASGFKYRVRDGTILLSYKSSQQVAWVPGTIKNVARDFEDARLPLFIARVPHAKAAKKIEL